MMFPTPSSPAEFYLAQVITAERKRARDAGEEAAYTGSEATVASVLGSLYEGLEGEPWVRGGSNSATAAAVRKAAYIDCMCTCWRCTPLPTDMALSNHSLLLWEMKLEVEIVTLYNETIKLLVRKDSKDLKGDEGEEK